MSIKKRIKRRPKTQRASSSRTARPSKPTHEVSAIVRRLLGGQQSEKEPSRKDNNYRKNQTRNLKWLSHPHQLKSLRRSFALCASISQQTNLLMKEILTCLTS